MLCSALFFKQYIINLSICFLQCTYNCAYKVHTHRQRKVLFGIFPSKFFNAKILFNSENHTVIQLLLVLVL